MIFLLATGVSLFFAMITAALVCPARAAGELAAPAIAAAVVAETDKKTINLGF